MHEYVAHSQKIKTSLKHWPAFDESVVLNLTKVKKMWLQITDHQVKIMKNLFDQEKTLLKKKKKIVMSSVSQPAFTRF